ncbi:hypothetical protein EDB87DRAFT_1836673 [Lactarius vividus]|nr:hypothetical protein EDB87DRAFT_1836673 [Lactarius vividus]
MENTANCASLFLFSSNPLVSAARVSVLLNLRQDGHVCPRFGRHRPCRMLPQLPRFPPLWPRHPPSEANCSESRLTVGELDTRPSDYRSPPALPDPAPAPSYSPLVAALSAIKGLSRLAVEELKERRRDTPCRRTATSSTPVGLELEGPSAADEDFAGALEDMASVESSYQNVINGEPDGGGGEEDWGEDEDEEGGEDPQEDEDAGGMGHHAAGDDDMAWWTCSSSTLDARARAAMHFEVEQEEELEEPEVEERVATIDEQMEVDEEDEGSQDATMEEFDEKVHEHGAEQHTCPLQDLERDEYMEQDIAEVTELV